MQTSIQGTSNHTAIQLKGAHGTLDIYNIYNDCLHNATMEALDTHLKACRSPPRSALDSHLLWCGNFNRHHPLWDKSRNCHLFTATALHAANKLLEMIADHNMIMALPKDVPTLKVKSTKN